MAIIIIFAPGSGIYPVVCTGATIIRAIYGTISGLIVQWIE